MHDIERLDIRLWQGGFRFIAGRDGQFYTLPVDALGENDTINVSQLVYAYRVGRVTPGRVVAECCRLHGLPEFDVRDWMGANNDS